MGTLTDFSKPFRTIHWLPVRDHFYIDNKQFIAYQNQDTIADTINSQAASLAAESGIELEGSATDSGFELTGVLA